MHDWLQIKWVANYRSPITKNCNWIPKWLHSDYVPNGEPIMIKNLTTTTLEQLTWDCLYPLSQFHPYLYPVTYNYKERSLHTELYNLMVKTLKKILKCKVLTVLAIRPWEVYVKSSQFFLNSTDWMICL